MTMNVSRITLADLLWQVGSSNEFEERVDPTRMEWLELLHVHDASL